MRAGGRGVAVEDVFGLAAAGLVVGSIGLVVQRWGPGGLPDATVVLAFCLAIAAGELLRIALPGSRETAPMASAAALAFAITTEAPRGLGAVFGAPLVISATALAMVVGVLPHLVPG